MLRKGSLVFFFIKHETAIFQNIQQIWLFIIFVWIGLTYSLNKSKTPVWFYSLRYYCNVLPLNTQRSPASKTNLLTFTASRPWYLAGGTQCTADRSAAHNHSTEVAALQHTSFMQHAIRHFTLENIPHLKDIIHIEYLHAPTGGLITARFVWLSQYFR